MNEKVSELKPGEIVWCRIDAPEPGGYSVTIVSSGLKAFLPATNKIEIGKTVPTTFVCMNDEQALLTFAFTMGTSARVQHSTASDQENAFSVWADAYPKSISLRRAVDLVMPPITTSSMILNLDREKARQFFPTLEGTGFTGCMKVYCQAAFSRGALIFLNGRAVGCIYTRKPVPDPYPFELGIKKMVEDVTSEDAESELEMYELPKEIIIAMSALFQGYIDKADAQLDNSTYAQQLLDYFSAKRETACFNLLDVEPDIPFALSFVHEGEFQGTYIISERLFSKEPDFFFDLLQKSDSTFKLQAHILPKIMTTEAMRFGYSLSSEQFKFR